MAGKRRVETEVEKNHGHCADLLMSDYGIDKKHRIAVCEEIHKIYKQGSYIHCIIIAGVRGYQSVPVTRSLAVFLARLQTHEPKNHKSQVESSGRSSGHYDSRGYFHQH